MKTTDKAIAAYGLDGYTLMTSSSSTMLASLKKAMDKGEWMVITGWTPHWMFDLFYLNSWMIRRKYMETWKKYMLLHGKDSVRKIRLLPNSLATSN